MARPALSDAQRRHLTELVDIADHGQGYVGWGPQTPGEWAVARALVRRGLLQRNVSMGSRPFELEGEHLERARRELTWHVLR